MRGASFFPKQPVSSFRIIFLSTLYISIPLNLSLWQFIFSHLEIHGFATALFALSYPLLIFGVVWIILNVIVWPYVAKPLLSAVILAFSLANYWMCRYNIHINSDMIRNIFETNNREAFDLVTIHLVLWILVSGILPAALLCLVSIRYQPFLKETGHRAMAVVLSMIIIGIIAIFFYKDHASFGRNHHQMIHLVSPVNYINGTIKYFRKTSMAKRQFEILDKHAKLTPYSDPYPAVFILIVGETARAANFSLNGYPRQTNPKLEKERILNFPNVYACGTATAVSVPCMFSSQPKSKFNVDDAKMTQNLLDILSATKYDVFWKENDNGCKGVCDRIRTENIDPKNTISFCDGKSCFDGVMLEDLEDYLATITRDTFIVLHTIGSHGPTYYQRYPDAFRKFTPTCDTSDLHACSQEQIRNTYDNTILYTDYVIAEAIRILKRFPYFESGLMYVSDHGESLGENGIYLHGMPYAIAPENQKKVPMMFWMSDNMIKYDHLDYACLQNKAEKYVYSHDNLFHSLLGLMEVDSKLYDSKLDIFDSCRLQPLPKGSKENSH